MDKETIVKKVKMIIEDVLDDDSVEISINSTTDNTDGWDSLSHILIMSDVEDEFDIDIPTNIMQKLKSVNEIVNFIMETKE